MATGMQRATANDTKVSVVRVNDVEARAVIFVISCFWLIPVILHTALAERIAIWLI